MNQKQAKTGQKTKKLVALLVLSGVISACGSSESSSAPAGPTCATYAGHYVSDVYVGQTMDIDSACNFTDAVCGYTATFTVPVGTTTTITVAGTNGTPGCLANTSHSCQVELVQATSKLYVDCGGSNFDILTRM